ncbi:MAG: ethanolamine ammonia-lyase reactivating factor EutA, partial [Flavobacteriaceae bacterium]|nr:ethanolamine ammonia-lyase reactivating factor EutA [Flavobacteriaceae bacterium]
MLQNGFDLPLDYFGRPWSSDISVPFYNGNELGDRFIPGQDFKYPYLTVSDFLEPYLIQVPYAIDHESFFDGNPEGLFRGDKNANEPPDDMYLIPIKKQFFDFFDAGFLRERTSDGRPKFRMVKTGLDGIRVELLIPIEAEGHYITFERLYKADSGKPDELKNEGSIVKGLFNLGFLPFSKPEGMVEQYVGFVDTEVIFDGPESQYSLNFLEITGRGCVARSPKHQNIRSDEAKGHKHNASSKYFVLNQRYDLIEVSKPGNIKGLAIPLENTFREGKHQFTFAIDFGTTNTHIEYVMDNAGMPRPFEITEQDRQLVTFSDRVWNSIDYPQLDEILQRELAPYRIGDSQKYRLPLRTATSEIDSLNHFQATASLVDINIPFHYQKQYLLPSEVVTTNLKWVSFRGKEGTENNNRARAFIETILILIKNKVLLNKGHISKTQVIWFYPASMSVNQVEQYKRIWNELYQKHFDPDGETQAFSESIAPFYNYSTTQVKSKEFPVVNIDIGGGTTDIVLFSNDKPLLLTSMKFGGNVVFGDGYDDLTIIKNGFVRAFNDDVKRFLNENESTLYELNRVFDQLLSSANSVEIMNFFLSLENNKDLEDHHLEFRFSEILGTHEKFGIVFLVFYGAIVYHLAKLMKAADCEMPRNICLSGNGSRIINLLDQSGKLNAIKKLSKIIFERVYDRKYHAGDLDIVQGENPKQATCKGGVRLWQKGKLSETFDKLVLLGDMRDTMINNDAHHFPKTGIKYRDIDNNTKEQVISEVDNFID